MSISTLIRVGSFALMLASACKPGEKGEGKSDGAKDVSTTKVGTHTCKALKGKLCVGPTDTFEASADEVNVVYTTKDLPKKGDVYVIEWIAVNVGDDVAPKTMVSKVDVPVEEVDSDFVSYTVEGSLSKPTKGWPKGKYRVDVKLRDEVVTSARFEIE